MKIKGKMEMESNFNLTLAAHCTLMHFGHIHPVYYLKWTFGIFLAIINFLKRFKFTKLTWIFKNVSIDVSSKLGSVAGPVIQTNGRLTFEDNLRSGGLLTYTVNLRKQFGQYRRTREWTGVKIWLLHLWDTSRKAKCHWETS